VNLELIQGCRFEEAALSRGDLTEVEWRILKVLLPIEREAGKRGRGRPPEDNRNIINGILWRLRTGAPWRDVPEKYGNWNSIYRRFRRWSACGVWESVAVALAEAMAESGHYNIDSTTVRAHVSAAGGNVWPAPSASGFCGWPKTVCTNVSGLPAMPLTKMEIRAFCSS
jgi:transposase